jgi:hypothetical protein
VLIKQDAQHIKQTFTWCGVGVGVLLTNLTHFNLSGLIKQSALTVRESHHIENIYTGMGQKAYITESATRILNNGCRLLILEIPEGQVESEQERDLSTYKVGRMHIRFDHMM